VILVLLLLALLMANSSGQCLPILCSGIQHAALTQFTKDETNHPFCLSKWSDIRGAWHSKECLFVVDSSGSGKKNRCSKCTTAHSNIRFDRVPELYPDRLSHCHASEHHILPDAYQLISVDEDALRRQIDDLLPWKLAFIVKSLKLMGKSSLVLDHHHVFVVCTGEGCDLFHVKKPRSNLGLECDKCIAVRNNEKRCAIRKETNKNMRIAANSSCPMRFLDNYELKDRVGRLNTNRNIKS